MRGEHAKNTWLRPQLTPSAIIHKFRKALSCQQNFFGKCSTPRKQHQSTKEAKSPDRELRDYNGTVQLNHPLQDLLTHNKESLCNVLPFRKNAESCTASEPTLSTLFTSAPLAISCWTTFSWPLQLAQLSGVAPSWKICMDRSVPAARFVLKSLYFVMMHRHSYIRCVGARWDSPGQAKTRSVLWCSSLDQSPWKALPDLKHGLKRTCMHEITLTGWCHP